MPSAILAKDKDAFAGQLGFLLMAAPAQEHLKTGGRHILEPIFWEGSSLFVGTALLLMRRRKPTNRVLATNLAAAIAQRSSSRSGI